MSLTKDSLVRAATSKSSQRAVLNSVLLTVTSAALFLVALAASLAFYHSYVPPARVAVPIYLQYGSALHPFGVAPAPRLQPFQHYNVEVHLTVPPSPANRQRGNFMVSLELSPDAADAVEQRPEKVAAAAAQGTLRARRPALLPYTDDTVVRALNLLALPYRLLVGRAQVTQLLLRVPLAERVWYYAAGSLPRSVFVEVEAGQTLETYAVAVVFVAELRGLRWAMARHRVVAVGGLAVAFWGAEMVFLVVSWGVWTALGGQSGPRREQVVKVEREEEEPRVVVDVKLEQDEDEDEDVDVDEDEEEKSRREGHEGLRRRWYRQRAGT